eukprot:TRINITY_DN4571_c0_g2_i1.p1 TRINITY_DN4571_c0_g2~~TRINITY_DN4571_c0_g2_i1.p1  ORF type:complete len:761 (+),score=147.26 TRINITY_DN4571_c0_g2_i1:43-2283(+)
MAVANFDSQADGFVHLVAVVSDNRHPPEIFRMRNDFRMERLARAYVAFRGLELGAEARFAMTIPGGGKLEPSATPTLYGLANGDQILFEEVAGGGAERIEPTQIQARPNDENLEAAPEEPEAIPPGATSEDAATSQDGTRAQKSTPTFGGEVGRGIEIENMVQIDVHQQNVGKDQENATDELNGEMLVESREMAEMRSDVEEHVQDKQTKMDHQKADADMPFEMDDPLQQLSEPKADVPSEKRKTENRHEEPGCSASSPAGPAAPSQLSAVQRQLTRTGSVTSAKILSAKAKKRTKAKVLAKQKYTGSRETLSKAVSRGATAVQKKKAASAIRGDGGRGGRHGLRGRNGNKKQRNAAVQHENNGWAKTFFSFLPENMPPEPDVCRSRQRVANVASGPAKGWRVIAWLKETSTGFRVRWRTSSPGRSRTFDTFRSGRGTPNLRDAVDESVFTQIATAVKPELNKRIRERQRILEGETTPKKQLASLAHEGSRVSVARSKHDPGTPPPIDRGKNARGRGSGHRNSTPAASRGTTTARSTKKVESRTEVPRAQLIPSQRGSVPPTEQRHQLPSVSELSETQPCFGAGPSAPPDNDCWEACTCVAHLRRHPRCAPAWQLPWLVHLEERTVFGRGHGCDVVMDSPTTPQMISRCHSVIQRSKDFSHAIIDQASLNGVLVNGTRVKGRCVLRHGDVVTFGVFTARAELDYIYEERDSVRCTQDDLGRSAEGDARGDQVMADACIMGDGDDLA